MSDARNIAKPLTPTKSKKDEVLYWRDIDALSQPKQQKKPAKTKAKQKRKIRPTHDANTVTLQLSGEQIATVQCSQDGFHKLLTALIDYNIQHKREYGRYLDWDTLERLTRIKTGLSQARGLPNGAGQMAAKNVRDIFMRYTRSDGEPDCDPATLDHPETYNIYVTDIAAEQGKLRFPHIGWVDYVAPTAVRGVFESKGIHIKGAFLSHRNKLWRAEIRFKRLNGKQINQNVKFAFAVAKGYVEPDEKHMVDECLFEQILNLASELRLELDRYLPSKLIERRLAETEHPMNCHQLKQRLERHGVNAATPITWTGQLIEGLGKRPMSYSVREIFTANNRLDYSEDDATCEG